MRRSKTAARAASNLQQRSAERQEKSAARGGGAETSTGLARQVGQKPVRGSRIVTGERRCGEFCGQILGTGYMIDATASRNCGDLADFEGRVANGCWLG